jgi:hypothetical protein
MRAGRIRRTIFWTFVASCVLLEMILFGQMQQMKHARDFIPSESFVISNLILAGISLLIGIQVIRVGEVWQRIVGYCVCAYPVYVFLEHAAWAGNVAFTR